MLDRDLAGLYGVQPIRLPYVFTEHGVLMLANVLRGKTALRHYQEQRSLSTTVRQLPARVFCTLWRSPVCFSGEIPGLSNLYIKIDAWHRIFCEKRYPKAIFMSPQQYQACMEACRNCATLCHQCATACLLEEDVKSMVRCIQIDLECAALCNAAAEVMSLDGELSAQLCHLCEIACSNCAQECEDHPEMGHCRECAVACRRCAEVCAQMAEAV